MYQWTNEQMRMNEQKTKYAWTTNKQKINEQEKAEILNIILWILTEFTELKNVEGV